MKEVFLTNSLKLIKTYNKNYSNQDIEKIKYGLEGLYLTFTKLIIIIILALVLNIFKEVIIMLFFFNIIRFPAFGIHAEKSSTCLILSVLLIIGLTYLVKTININFYIKLLICTICFIDFVLFAPADTPKRPLTNKKKRTYRKISSCICSIAYILLILLTNETIISKMLLASIITESIVINPITYKILGVTYNNYKNMIKTQ